MDIHQIAKQLKSVSDNPMFEARLLMKYAGDHLAEWIERRLKYEPLFKIIGRRGFWKGEFLTSPDVLDPRPDSETVIESVLKHFPNQKKSYRILDIGMGSGCLLYSLLDEYPAAVGVGIDVSQKALKVAEQNRGNRKADLYQKDFFNSDWVKDLGLFDIIVSNPPYIPTKDIDSLAPEVRLYDPMSALDGGADGLDAYRALAKSVGTILKPDGLLFLEIGTGQAKSVTGLFQKDGWQLVEIISDFGQIERVLVFARA